MSLPQSRRPTDKAERHQGPWFSHSREHQDHLGGCGTQISGYHPQDSESVALEGGQGSALLTGSQLPPALDWNPTRRSHRVGKGAHLMSFHQEGQSSLSFGRGCWQAGWQMRNPGRGETRLRSGDWSREQWAHKQVRGISVSPWALFPTTHLPPSLPADKHISSAGHVGLLTPHAHAILIICQSVISTATPTRGG